MTGTTETTARRATSCDGNQIGYWTSGKGPPLVLVHGASALCGHPVARSRAGGMRTRDFACGSGRASIQYIFQI